MLCGVTATLGSNPSATATAARPHRGRAVLLCLGDVLCCCVAPRVFRAPEAPTMGPGCFVCPWAAARPRDRHTRACGSEWSISRPALALPPPTGTAAWPSGPTCALHTSGAWSLMLLGASPRCPVRPRHCPRVSQPGPPLPPAPFTPAAVGGFALHEAFWGCAVGVSDPHVVQFPPIGGGEAAT